MEISNFIDNAVDPELSAQIQAHLRDCHKCSVMVDSIRKVLYVVGDEKVFEIPVGYSERLHAVIRKSLGEEEAGELHTQKTT